MGEKLLKIPSHFSTERAYRLLVDLLFYVVGSILYGVSVTVFTAPNKIAPGGVTGIATILYYLIHTPIGVMYFILNIPLLLLGLRLIGGRFLGKTILCTILTSIVIDVMDGFHIYQYHNSTLLAALYGGVLSGIGLALVFLRGATTGGTDVASRLLKLKYPYISMGRMMMMIDAVIILISAFVFKSVDSALYALITIFVSSRLIDSILYGADTGKMAVIISDYNSAIAKAVTEQMDRGMTILKGKGYYTGSERDVLLCAVRRHETARLRSLVYHVDPKAFIIMCEAGEVIGEGFKPITKDI